MLFLRSLRMRNFSNTEVKYIFVCLFTIIIHFSISKRKHYDSLLRLEIFNLREELLHFYNETYL